MEEERKFKNFSSLAEIFRFWRKRGNLITFVVAQIFRFWRKRGNLRTFVVAESVLEEERKFKNFRSFADIGCEERKFKNFCTNWLCLGGREEI